MTLVCCLLTYTAFAILSVNCRQVVENHSNLNLLPLETCGVIHPTDRIILGSISDLFEFPWMALLGYFQDKENIGFKCAGTLINDRYVLTAAHCVSLKDNLSLKTVRLGEYNLTTAIDCVTTYEGEKECAEAVQDFAIEETIVHPDYKTKTHSNDIALLRLNSKVKMSDSVSPICLPVTTSYQNYKRDRGIISSWGRTEDKKQSDVLMSTSLPIVTEEECQERYTEFESINITDKHLCACNNKRSPCGGDSGSPLQVPVVTNYKPHFVQIGIASFGPNRCSMKDIPEVFTKVTKFTDWILDNIKP